MSLDPLDDAVDPGARRDRPPLALVVSVDTEEDNWVATRTGVTTENVSEAVPELDGRLRRLGVRTTYFTSYRVARDAASAAVLRDIVADGTAEVGAHLHPWNTPPYCGSEDRMTMLWSYPTEAQHAKIRQLLDAINTRIGVDPSSFRAGRFGVGREAVRALARAGLTVESSVTPLLSWRESEGPSFLEARNEVYPISADDNVCHPSARGDLVEVPITVGYTRLAPRSWNAMARRMDSPTARTLRLPALARRLAGVQKVILSPEAESARDMIRLGRHMLASGTRFLHMYFHSPSLVPGLTPFTRSTRDVSRLYDRIERFVEAMDRVADVEFMTVTEVARALGPAQWNRSSSAPLEEGSSHPPLA